MLRRFGPVDAANTRGDTREPVRDPIHVLTTNVVVVGPQDDRAPRQVRQAGPAGPACRTCRGARSSCGPTTTTLVVSTWIGSRTGSRVSPRVFAASTGPKRRSMATRPITWATHGISSTPYRRPWIV